MGPGPPNCSQRRGPATGSLRWSASPRVTPQCGPSRPAGRATQPALQSRPTAVAALGDRNGCHSTCHPACCGGGCDHLRPPPPPARLPDPARRTAVARTGFEKWLARQEDAARAPPRTCRQTGLCRRWDLARGRATGVLGSDRNHHRLASVESLECRARRRTSLPRLCQEG